MYLKIFEVKNWKRSNRIQIRIWSALPCLTVWSEFHEQCVCSDAAVFFYFYFNVINWATCEFILVWDVGCQQQCRHALVLLNSLELGASGHSHRAHLYQQTTKLWVCLYLSANRKAVWHCSLRKWGDRRDGLNSRWYKCPWKRQLSHQTRHQSSFQSMSLLAAILYKLPCLHPQAYSHHVAVKVQ